MSCEQWFWISADGATTVELTRWTNNTEVMKAGMRGRWHPKPVITRVVIPGRAGQYTQDRRHEYRTWTLPLAARGSAVAALQATLYQLAQIMDPLDGPGTLRYIGTDGRVSDLIAVQTADLDPSDWVGSSSAAGQMMVLTFEADEPYFLASEVNTSWQGSDPTPWFGIGGTGLWVPASFGGSAVIGDVTFNPATDADVWPIWDVVGPGADPVFTSDTLDDTFALSGVTLTAGQVIHIDLTPGVKTITGPGGVNLFPYLSSSSLWQLVKGTNHITLSLSGATSASYIGLRYRPRRLAP